MIQGTDEWVKARLGMVTASRIADMMAQTKSGWGASRANYCADLVAERLTGVPTETYVSKDMEYGTEMEPAARRHYAFYRDAEVVETGFVPHPTLALTGASPDGLVGTDGLLELKCPKTATHIGFLRGRSVPGKYVLQMQWQMACTGRKWCDFVSYNSKMPPRLQLFVARCMFDAKKAAEIYTAIVVFLEEVQAIVDELTDPDDLMTKLQKSAEAAE